MKTILLMLLSILAFSNLTAQQNNLDHCPKPKAGKMESFCNCIGGRNMEYELRLFEMSCVTENGSESVKKQKLRKMWEKYKLEFTCE